MLWTALVLGMRPRTRDCSKPSAPCFNYYLTRLSQPCINHSMVVTTLYIIIKKIHCCNNLEFSVRAIMFVFYLWLPHNMRIKHKSCAKDLFTWTSKSIAVHAVSRTTATGIGANSVTATMVAKVSRRTCTLIDICKKMIHGLMCVCSWISRARARARAREESIILMIPTFKVYLTTNLAWLF